MCPAGGTTDKEMRLQWRKADIAIGKAGVEATEREGAATVVLDEADIELPDPYITDSQGHTQLTRCSIYHILSGSYNPDWAVLIQTDEGELSCRFPHPAA